MLILIVGSQGMLGQEFVKQLGSRRSLAGAEVTGWGKEDIDITNEKEVMQKICSRRSLAGAKARFDVIINCAAYNNVDKAEEEPEIANLINGEAPGYLARAAAECGAIFVHFSTDYVFSGNRPVGKNSAAAENLTAGEYTEEDTPDPISKYGESKALGEYSVSTIPHDPASRSVALPFGSVAPIYSAGRREESSFWYIVRTSKLFGPPGTGATSKKSFPEMMIGFARQKGKIEAIDSEVGSPTYVKDLAEATLQLLGFPPLRVRGGEEGLRTAHNSPQPPLTLRGGVSGIYKINKSGSCTWYEYAKAAVEFAGIKAEVVPVGPDYFPRKAKRPAKVVLLNTKLPPLRSWQDALKEFLKAV